MVIKPPMNEQIPAQKGVSTQTQTTFHLAVKLREEHVYGDNVRIKTIGSRRVDQIEMKTADVTVPPTPEMVGDKPPAKRHEMRPR
jgi:glyceraldehyde-3-phosphate dehydrogenase/erythrose-4-phosphate dehydrogenase